MDMKDGDVRQSRGQIRKRYPYREYEHDDQRSHYRQQQPLRHYRKNNYNHRNARSLGKKFWPPMEYLPELNYHQFKFPMAMKVDSKFLTYPKRKLCKFFFMPNRGCKNPNCTFYHPNVCYYFLQPHKECSFSPCHQLHVEGTIQESLLFMQRENEYDYTEKGSYFRKQLDKVDRLNIFDFDGTLANSWEPLYGKAYYERITGKECDYTSWWSNPETLSGPLEPKHGPASEMISTLPNPNHYNIMLTGRNAACLQPIVKACHNMGIHGKIHKYVCKPDNWQLATLHFKLAFIVLFLQKQMPRVRKIHIWEDRKAHTYFFQALAQPLSKLLGRRIKIVVHEVHPTPLGLLLGDSFADVNVVF